MKTNRTSMNNLNQTIQSTKLPEHLIQMHDTDKDGKISTDDFDANHDGKIDGAELTKLNSFVCWVKAEEEAHHVKAGTAQKLHSTITSYVKTSLPKAKKTNTSTTSKAIDSIIKKLDLGTKLTVETKEKVAQLVQATLRSLTGGNGKEVEGILAKLGKAKAGSGVIQSLGAVISELNKPNPNKRLVASNLLKAMGDGFDLLPSKVQNKLVNQSSKLLAKSRRLRPLARLMQSLHKVGAGPECIKLVGSFLSLKPSEIAKSVKDLGKKLAQQKEPKKLWNLSMALLKLIPPKMRLKMMEKFVGRKIPAIGTALVAIGDIGDLAAGIWKGCTTRQWRSFNKASVGALSTAAGLIPIAGTTASALIDLGSLAEDISHTASQISNKIKIQ